MLAVVSYCNITYEIFDELISQKCEVIKIAQFTSKKDRKILPLYQVHLKFNTNSLKILELKNINYFHVTVEKYRTPIPQCQNFYHNSANCFMTPRCVKCAQNHLTSECPFSSEIKVKNDFIKCCNCNGNHRTSFKVCDKFPKLPNYSKNSKPLTETPITQPVSSISFTGKTYAQSLNNLEETKNTQLPNNDNAVQNNSAINDIIEFSKVISKIVKMLKISNIKVLINKIKDLLINLKTSNDPSDRLRLILDAVC